MKKIIAMFIILSMLFSLTACDTKKFKSDKTGTWYEAADYTPMTVPKYDDFDDEQDYFKAYKEWIDFKCGSPLSSDYFNITSDYYNKCVSALLSGTDNASCAPTNIYIALSILANTTDNNSRKQILSLLNADNLDSLNQLNNQIWTSSVKDDEYGITRLINSLWLNDAYNYNSSVFEKLSTDYYTTSYIGKVGTPKYNSNLQDWINTQTENVLTKEVSNITTSKDTVLELISTIYFNSNWEESFSEQNVSMNFNGLNKTKKCDFMKTSYNSSYYKKDGFAAISKVFEDKSKMWFILPDEGTTPADLIKNNAVVNFIFSNPKEESMISNAYKTINLSVPKFNVSSKFNLATTLTSLGITDIFDSTTADFSPISDNTDIYCSSATHISNVKIDECGGKVATSTDTESKGHASDIEHQTIDFTLDRPFIFAIANDDGLPIFFGTICNM